MFLFFRFSLFSHDSGTIAACVLGAFLSLLTLLPICCTNKCGTVLLQLLSRALLYLFQFFNILPHFPHTTRHGAVLCCAAAVGCWTRFQMHTLNESLAEGKFSFTLGFYLAAISVVSSLAGLIGACFVNKGDREGYGYLA